MPCVLMHANATTGAALQAAEQQRRSRRLGGTPPS